MPSLVIRIFSSCIVFNEPIRDDPKLSGDNGEVPIFKWSGSQFNSYCKIFSLLDGGKGR